MVRPALLLAGAVCAAQAMAQSAVPTAERSAQLVRMVRQGQRSSYFCPRCQRT